MTKVGVVNLGKINVLNIRGRLRNRKESFREEG